MTRIETSMARFAEAQQCVDAAFVNRPTRRKAASRKAARPVNRTPLADYRARRMAGARPAVALIAGMAIAAGAIWAACTMAESHAGRPAVGTAGLLPTLESVATYQLAADDSAGNRWILDSGLTAEDCAAELLNPPVAAPAGARLACVLERPFRTAAQESAGPAFVADNRQPHCYC